jgi:flagellar basal body-associated protein FliL
MKINYGKIIAMWVLLMWSMCTLLWLTSCSAQHHLKKYQSKGGVCGKIDTIRVTKFDTLTNTFYYHDSIIVVNDRIVPLTRQEIRYRYKIHYDTLKHKETIVKEITKQAKEETKQTKAENRSPWIWVILAVIGLVALVLIKTNRI